MKQHKKRKHRWINKNINTRENKEKQNQGLAQQGNNKDKNGNNRKKERDNRKPTTKRIRMVKTETRQRKQKGIIYDKRINNKENNQEKQKENKQSRKTRKTITKKTTKTRQ
jgi:hypothetical protein